MRARPRGRDRAGWRKRIPASWFEKRMALERDPGAPPLAFGDGLAELKFAMAVGKRRIERLRRAAADADVLVDRAVHLLEGVGEALVVPARIAGKAGDGRIEEG